MKINYKSIYIIILALLLFFPGCSPKSIQEEPEPPQEEGDYRVEITEWNQFRGSSLKMGYLPTFPVLAKTVATMPAEGDVMSSAAIRDNRVYIGSLDCHLYAFIFDEEPTPEWKFKAGHKIISSPGLDEEGNIYFGCQDKSLYSLTPDGRLRWRFKTGGAVSSSPAVFKDKVYFGSFDGNLYCLDLNGKKKWAFKVEHSDLEVMSSPVVDSDGSVYIGSDNGNIYGVYRDGNLKWKFKADGPVVATPAIMPDGSILASSMNGSVYRISNTGQIIWRFSADSPIESSAAVHPDDITFIGSTKGTVYCLDRDGRPVWTYKTAGPVTGSGALDGIGNLYITSEDNNIYSFSRDGELRWKVETGGKIFSSPTLGFGFLVVGSDDDKVYFVSGTEEVEKYMPEKPSPVETPLNEEKPL